MTFGPLGAKALDGFLAAMRRAVVHDPEDTVRRLVGLLTHNLRDQAVGGGDAALDLAATEQLGAPVPAGAWLVCDVLACTLVFSSAEITKSFSCKGSPSQTR